MVHENAAWESSDPAEIAGAFEPDRLRCPWCGYRVYGISSSQCPECGKSIDWAQIRAFAMGEKTDLIEHRLFRQPVRATLRTWYRAAFYPERVWEKLSAYNQPAIFPLVVLIALQIVVFYYGWDLVARVVDPAMNTLADYRLGPKRFPLWGFTYHLNVNPPFFKLMAVWYGFTYLIMLLCFDPTTCPGSRVLQVLRVSTYTTAFAALCPAIWCVLEALIDLTTFCRPVSVGAFPTLPGIDPSVYILLARGIFAVGVIVTWMHLWTACDRYLKLRNGWAVAAWVLTASYIFADLAVTLSD